MELEREVRNWKGKFRNGKESLELDRKVRNRKGKFGIGKGNSELEREVQNWPVKYQTSRYYLRFVLAWSQLQSDVQRVVVVIDSVSFSIAFNHVKHEFWE